MFKLFGLKWKREFESLKALHDIEMSKKENQLKLLEMELTKKHEISLLEATSLIKLEYQQKIKQQELDFKRNENELKTKVELEKAQYQKTLQDDNYERLKNAMTKLHEEGNVTTQFTQEIALKMLDKVPAAKFEHKQITGSVDVNADVKNG